MVRLDKKHDTLVRVLRPGESSLLDRHIADLEIILFRALRPVEATPRTSIATSDVNNVNGEASNNNNNNDNSPADKGNDAADKSAAPPEDSVMQASQQLSVHNGESASYNSASRRETGQQDQSGGALSGGDGRLPFPPVNLPQGNSARPHAVEFSAPEPPRPPLFFDTTACAFYGDINKIDYVATGRDATDMKEVRHRPHTVVVGNETFPASAGAYCSYNIAPEDVRDCGGAAAGPAGAAGQKRSDGAAAGAMGNASGGNDYAEEPRQPPPRNVPEATAINHGVTMAAGDGIVVSFRRLNLCSGILVNASLFTKDVSFDSVKDAYYMVRRQGTTIPLCLVPVNVPDSRYHSSTALMLRRVRVHGETVWEVVNVNEPLRQKDVKAVLSDLERRGLGDPVGYVPDFDPRGMDSAGGLGSMAEDRWMSERRGDCLEYLESDDDDYDEEEEEEEEEGDDDGAGEQSVSRDNAAAAAAAASANANTNGNNSSSDGAVAGNEDGEAGSGGGSGGEAGAGAAVPLPEPRPKTKTFEDLLARVPVVTREGRRLYNVGHPHVRSTASAAHLLSAGGYSEEKGNAGVVSSDEDEEILEDALRAAVPRYGSSGLVRYDDGTYNVGSRAETLVLHYVDRRESYALQTAATAKRTGPSTAGGGGGRGATLPVLPLRAQSCGNGADSLAPYIPSDRCVINHALLSDNAEDTRVPLPPEFTYDPSHKRERRRSGWGNHPRRVGSASQKKGSLTGSGGKRGKSKGRGRSKSKGKGKGKGKGGKRRSKSASSSRAASRASSAGSSRGKKGKGKGKGKKKGKRSASRPVSAAAKE